jgi:hypothetical protein
MELKPVDDRQTEAMMWVEVDLKNVMRAVPGRVLNGRIRRVMDIEIAAIKAALESATRDGSDSYRRVGAVAQSAQARTGSRERRDATEIGSTS